MLKFGKISARRTANWLQRHHLDLGREHPTLWFVSHCCLVFLQWRATSRHQAVRQFQCHSDNCTEAPIKSCDTSAQHEAAEIALHLRTLLLCEHFIYSVLIFPLYFIYCSCIFEFTWTFEWKIEKNECMQLKLSQQMLPSGACGRLYCLSMYWASVF